MTLVRSIIPAALWLCLGLLQANAQGVTVDSDPMQVMTDTPEYCWHLANEVAATPRELRLLAKMSTLLLLICRASSRPESA